MKKHIVTKQLVYTRMIEWNSLKRCVFSLDLKLVRLVQFLSSSGSSFHSLGPADPKALAQ